MVFSLVQLLKAEPLMLFTLSGIFTEVILSHPVKAKYPIHSTPSGIVTLPLQVLPSISIPFTTTRGFFFILFLSHFVLLYELDESPNASPPMSFKFLGIVMFLRFMQQLNA